MSYLFIFVYLLFLVVPAVFPHSPCLVDEALGLQDAPRLDHAVQLRWGKSCPTSGEGSRGEPGAQAAL